MPVTVNNQRPADLSPVYTLPVDDVFDPAAAISTTLVDPMFQPLNTSSPVTITDDQGQDLTHDDVMAAMALVLSEEVNTPAEQLVGSLLEKVAIRYTSGLMANEVFVAQAAGRHKLPAPSPKVIYTAQSDVIPACKNFVIGRGDESELLACFGLTYAPATLGVYFRNNACFKDFKDWLDAEVTKMSANLDPDVLAKFSQLGQIDLGKLTESLLLRKGDDDGDEEYSLPRVLTEMLMRYTTVVPSSDYGLLPFSATELYRPSSLVLVNVEVHSRSNPSRVDREWQMIKQSLANPVKIISNRKLTKLTTLHRAAAKARSAAASSLTNKSAQLGRSARIKIRKRPPRNLDIAKAIMRVIKGMERVNMSMNVTTGSRRSFMKPNRRDPDNYNMAGRRKFKKYLPDLHVYLDCSGSISSVNYQDSVMFMIAIAKKLDVDLYITCFSHFMGQEIKLRVKGRSVKDVWTEFDKIPKITGGTDFQQVWQHINASRERGKRFNLMITDFEWQPGPQREHHPKNLYYAPCSAKDWATMSYWAKNYVVTTKHIEPAMAARLLGMVA